MVKLFGWEQKMLKMIQSARNEELLSIWWLKVRQCILAAFASIHTNHQILGSSVGYGDFKVRSPLILGLNPIIKQWALGSSLIPTIAMLTTYVTYTVIMKKELTRKRHLNNTTALKFASTPNFSIRYLFKLDYFRHASLTII